jgi:hypothetical protein
VIDVRLLRTNLDGVRSALARRGKPDLLAQVDEAVALDSRIREIKKGGYESSIKDIFRVYKNWFEAVGGGVGRKLNQSELLKRMCDKFGTPSDGKTFKQLRLFEDDYELDEYEKSLGDTI